MGEIVTVNFRGDELYGFKQDDGVFVALKPIVEAMGMAWNAQFERVNRDPVLSKGVRLIRIPFGRGGAQDATCLSLDRMNGWLFGIDSSRIKDEEVRKRVILYQEECCDVLYAHFAGKKVANSLEIDGEPTDEKTDAEKLAHVREVRHTFDAYAARQMYFALGLQIVPAMIRPEQNELFTTYTAIRHPERDAA